MSLGFVEAFSKYGATLKNPMWAVSAIAGDGAIVISCWHHYFKKAEKGVLPYDDMLSRWNGNSLGNSLLRQHVTDAFEKKIPVRLVVAKTDHTDEVDHGHDASKVPKTFHIREDLVGTVTLFDGDRFVIEFKRREA